MLSCAVFVILPIRFTNYSLIFVATRHLKHWHFIFLFTPWFLFRSLSSFIVKVVKVTLLPRTPFYMIWVSLENALVDLLFINFDDFLGTANKNAHNLVTYWLSLFTFLFLLWVFKLHFWSMQVFLWKLIHFLMPLVFIDSSCLGFSFLSNHKDNF